MMPSPAPTHRVLGEVVRDDVRGPVARQIWQVVFRRPDAEVVCVSFPRARTAQQLEAAIAARHLEVKVRTSLRFTSTRMKKPIPS